MSPSQPTYSPYGISLAEVLNDNGVEVVLAYPGHEDTEYGSLERFLIQKLSAK